MTRENEVEQFEHNGYIIRILYDIEPGSPREWDNVGTMVCWHNRYNLGDEQPKLNPLEWKRELVLGQWKEAWFPNDLREAMERGIDSNRYVDDISDEQIDEVLEKHFIILPLYLFDHSGIIMSTSSSRFSAVDSAGWDWGQVGFIYCSMEKARSEFSGTDAEITEKAIQCLTGEVETYSQYLEGDVYGYIIEDQNKKHIDSCWGFYGMEDVVDQAKACCPDAPVVNEEYVANV